MKLLRRILLSACTALVPGCHRGSASKSPSKPDDIIAELAGLPTGIEVLHTPSAVKSPRGPSQGGWKYQWAFRTEVRALDQPLRITRFGIIAWDGRQWVMPPDQRQFNSGVMSQQTFIEWYSCPGAMIAPGKPAIDSQNWAGSYTFTDFKQKWFYIGVDANGKSYKGEGVITLIAQH